MIENQIKHGFSYLLSIFLFLLPWQTIFIFQEKMLNGVKWQYGTMGFYATEALLWVCVVLFIGWYWKERGNKEMRKLGNFWTHDRIFVLSCLLFIVYCFLTIAWAADKEIAFQHAFRVLEAFLLFFVLFLGPLRWEKAAAWFVAGATLQSILGIWQFLSQSTFSSMILGLTAHPAWEAGSSIVGVEGERWIRAYGAFSHPNILGGYVAISLLFTVFLFYKDDKMADRKLRNYEIKKLAVFVSLLLQTTALFFTFSRSAWIGAAIVFLFSCFLVLKNKTGRLCLVVCILYLSFFGTIFFQLVHSRVSGGTISETRSANERISGYLESWSLIKQHPFLGVGAGNYTAALYLADSGRPGWEYQPVHDVLLLFLTEHGVIGLVLFLSMIVTFVKYITIEQLNNGTMGIIGLAAILPLLLFDHYLYSSYAGLLIGAVFFGMAARFPHVLHSSSTVQ